LFVPAGTLPAFYRQGKGIEQATVELAWANAETEEHSAKVSDEEAMKGLEGIRSLGSFFALFYLL
jgi:hypothetical protein